MKWEAWGLMALLITLGFVLVYRPGGTSGLSQIRLGNSKAELVEIDAAPDGSRRFALEYRHGPRHEIGESDLRATFGDEEVDRVLGDETRPLFRFLNITSLASLPWVILGFGAQIVFATRFLIQWIVSERKKESVIPVAFWWVSLFGGMALFVYFVWRRDAVGVLGQSSGIVIYGRNLRLIGRKKRREAASREAAPQETSGESR